MIGLSLRIKQRNVGTFQGRKERQVMKGMEKMAGCQRWKVVKDLKDMGGGTAGRQ